MNKAGTVLWNALLASTPIDTEPVGVLDFITMLIADELISVASHNDGEPYRATEAPVLTRYTDMQEMLLADPIHDVDTAGWPKLKSDTDN